MWTGGPDPGYIHPVSVYVFGTGWALMEYLRHARGLHFPSPSVPKRRASRLVPPLQVSLSVSMFETIPVYRLVQREECSQAKVTNLYPGY